MNDRSTLIAATLLCLCAAFALRVELIAGHGSYPGHFDEAFLARKALRMLQTGDPSPHWFRYGSLPIYLSAAGMAVGVQVERAFGGLASVAEVTSVHEPYFSHPLVMMAPRVLFALLSVLGLLSAGLLGHTLWRRPAALLLPIAALSCSSLYLEHSWTYLNVDIVATSLCLMALAYLARTVQSPGILQRAVVPALFCGAVVASKYNSGLLGVPFLVVALQSRRWSHVAALLLLSLAAFFVCQPFAAIEFPRFIADIRSEMEHYQRGHIGYDGEPGIAQLAFYLRRLGADYGWPLALCVVLGVRRGLAENRRATLLVLSFPVLLLLYMSLQRVHFIRNVLPAFAALGVFMGLGALELWDIAQRAAGKAFQGPDAPFSALARLAHQAAAALVMALTLGPGLYDVARLAAQPISDSRIEVGRWLDQHAKGRCQLVIPTQLVIDERDLQRCEVMRVDLADKTTAHQVRATSDGFTERYAIPGTFEDTMKSTRARNKAWRVFVDGSETMFQAGRAKLRLAPEARRKGQPNPKLQLYRLKPRRA